MPRLEYMYPGGENFIARDDAGELWLYYRYVDRGPLKFKALNFADKRRNLL